MKQRFKTFWKKIKKVIAKPIMKILPGQLAFFLVLSMIPFVYLVGVVGNMFSLSVDSFIGFIRDSFPSSSSKLIIPLISGKGFDFNVLLFVLSAFALASNGTNSIIVTSNTLYEIGNTNYVRRRIKALLLTAMIVILLGFIIVVPAFGDMILTTLTNLKYIKPFSDEILIIYNVLKLPLSFMFIYFNIKIIYTIAPDRHVKSKDSTYGAVFTTLGWIVATRIYSYYVSNFVNYDIFYGSIANLIILLLWIYLLSYIFVVGLALNTTAVAGNKDELKNKKSK